MCTHHLDLELIQQALKAARIYNYVNFHHKLKRSRSLVSDVKEMRDVDSKREGKHMHFSFNVIERF